MIFKLIQYRDLPQFRYSAPKNEKNKIFFGGIQKMSHIEAELALFENAEETGKGFRLNCKRVHLTYKSHIEIEDLLDFVQKATKVKIVAWSGCQEIGKTEYDHTHIGVEFEAKIDVRNSRTFDYNGIHPNIKKVSTATHWTNILTYHIKEPVTFKTNRIIRENKKSKTETCSNIAENGTVTGAFSYKTLGEAITGINDLKLTGGIIAAWKFKEKEMPEEPTNIWWLPWQDELRIELQGEADERRFIWYYDQPGDSGKSIFAEHALAYWKNTLVLTTVNSRDVATIVDAVTKRGAEIETIIVDLSRSNKKELMKPELYRALEELKNGVITVTKYEGGTVHLKRTHIVVFSNSEPMREMSVKNTVRYDDGTCGIKYDMEPTVSTDRWDIRTLGPITHPKFPEKTVGVIHREVAPRKYIHVVPEGYVKPGLPRK